MTNNTLANNTGSALYFHTSGEYNTLQVDATNNICTNNGGGFAFATPCSTFGLNATNNMLSSGRDNGIAIIGAGVMDSANITIADNQITDNTNGASGIALSSNVTDLNFTVRNNTISNNEGSGITMYPGTGVETATLTIENNTVSNNQNAGSNATGGIDIEQYENLTGFITNNTLLDNVGPGLYLGSTLPTPSTLVELSGNTSGTGYTLANPVDGTFELAPCNVTSSNSGDITEAGTITHVQSCDDPVACP